MSIDSALIVQRDRVPKTIEVVEAIRGYGHNADFPEGFEFGSRDNGLWRTVSFDGDESGFDYVLSSLDDWEDDAEITFPRHVGDALIEFGARGNASIKLVAHVQRAICEISDAHGWIEQELISPGQMVADCKATAENWDTIAEKLEADWAAMPRPAPPPPLTIGERVRKWLDEGGWFSLLGCAIGAALIVYLVIVK